MNEMPHFDKFEKKSGGLKPVEHTFIPQPTKDEQGVNSEDKFGFEVLETNEGEKNTVLVRLSNEKTISFNLAPVDDRMDYWDEFLRTRNFNYVFVRREITHGELMEEGKGAERLENRRRTENIRYDEQAEALGITPGELIFAEAAARTEFKKRYSKA
jgi:hypothetical protein